MFDNAIINGLTSMITKEYTIESIRQRRIQITYRKALYFELLEGFEEARDRYYAGVRGLVVEGRPRECQVLIWTPDIYFHQYGPIDGMYCLFDVSEDGSNYSVNVRQKHPRLNQHPHIFGSTLCWTSGNDIRQRVNNGDFESALRCILTIVQSYRPRHCNVPYPDSIPCKAERCSNYGTEPIPHSGQQPQYYDFVCKDHSGICENCGISAWQTHGDGKPVILDRDMFWCDRCLENLTCPSCQKPIKKPNKIIKGITRIPGIQKSRVEDMCLECSWECSMCSTRSSNKSEPFAVSVAFDGTTCCTQKCFNDMSETHIRTDFIHEITCKPMYEYRNMEEI